MRARFIFSPLSESSSQLRLPVCYRTLFMGFLKTVLSNYNREYFDRLYWWQDKKNKWQKPFTFAVGLPNLQYEDDWVLLNGNIILNISSSDYEFMVNIYNSILKKENYPFRLTDDVSINLKNFYLLNEPLFSDKMLFKTFSPILIEKKELDKKVPVLPYDDGFEDVFNDVIDFEIRNIRLLRGVQNGGLKKRLTFRPLNIKKVVVKHRISEFVEKTDKPLMFLTCFSGVFELSGDAEDLKEIYQNGIGFRRAQGFGYVEVAR